MSDQSLSETRSGKTKKRDQKKIYSLVEVFVGRSENLSPKGRKERRVEKQMRTIHLRGPRIKPRISCVLGKSQQLHTTVVASINLSLGIERLEQLHNHQVSWSNTFFISDSSDRLHRSHMTQYHCGYCKLGVPLRVHCSYCMHDTPVTVAAVYLKSTLNGTPTVTTLTYTSKV